MNRKQTMAEIIERFGGDGLERIDTCLDVLAGEVDPEISHDDQEPTRLFFPGLRAQPWWDTAELPWAASVEAAYPAIVAELDALVSDGARFAPYEDPYTFELGWTGWDTFSLYRYGVWRDGIAERCPATTAALAATPHGPRDGMFTLLRPGSHITPHTGGVNLLLTCHLGLHVPEGCAIGVGGHVRTWDEGRCLVFDDSFMHEAWNRGEGVRSVLLWDIWHPDLTAREVDVLLWVFPQYHRYLLGGRDPLRPDTVPGAGT